MKQSKKLMALPLFYALMLTACNNNNSIPSSYIGFKNTQTNHHLRSGTGHSDFLRHHHFRREND